MEIDIFSFGNEFSQYERDPVTGLEHARHRTVRLAGGKRPILLEVRNLLVHQSAELASGSEWIVVCHNLSVVLRSIADTYYPAQGSWTDVEDDDLIEDEEAIEGDECGAAIESMDPPASYPKLQPFVRSDFEVPSLAMHDGYALSAGLIEERLAREDGLYAPVDPVLLVKFPDRALETHGVSGLLISHVEMLHLLHASHVQREFQKIPYEAKYRILGGEMVEALNRRHDEWEAFCASLRAAPASALPPGAADSTPAEPVGLAM